MSVGSLGPVQGPAEDPSVVAATPANRVRVEFTPGRFVIWVGAVAILWLVLSVLSDSGNADVARAVAGLIVFGMVMALGPGAIGNARGLVQTTGG